MKLKIIPSLSPGSNPVAASISSFARSYKDNLHLKILGEQKRKPLREASFLGASIFPSRILIIKGADLSIRESPFESEGIL